MLIADKIRLKYLLEFGTSTDWEFDFVESISEKLELTNKQVNKLQEIYSKIRSGNYTDPLFCQPSHEFLDVSYDEVHDFDK